MASKARVILSTPRRRQPGSLQAPLIFHKIGVAGYGTGAAFVAINGQPYSQIWANVKQV